MRRRKVSTFGFHDYFFTFSCWFLLRASTTLGGTIISNDYQPLIAFKLAIVQNFPSALPTWIEHTDPCGGGWEGISCEGGNVVSLNLSSSLFEGDLPFDSLTRLLNLRKVDLSNNQFTGMMDQSIENLKYLTYLDLSLNHLGGTIPSALSKCSNLTHLILNGNKLSGSLPDSLGDLTRLSTLKIGNNKLVGHIPDSFQHLNQLRMFSGFSNSLSGLLPVWIGYLQELTFLELFANDFEGPIPDSFGRALSLTHMALDLNKLSGKLPPSLGQLNLLKSLYLSSNHFVGEIPSSFSNLVSLERLDLSYNENLGGELPPFLAKITSLKSISLIGCSFSGAISPAYGNLIHLQELMLKKNQITGTLPPSLGKLASLTTLLLQRNFIEGPIPTSFCNLNSAININLSKNKLNGTFPLCLLDLPNIITLYFTDNSLIGTIPNDRLQSTSIQLGYDNNCLAAVPNQIASCSIGYSNTENTTPATPSYSASQVTSPSPPATSYYHKKDSGGGFGILLIFALLFVVAILGGLVYRHFSYLLEGSSGGSRIDLPVTEYSLSKIKRATRNFTTVYGKGSFGTVYLGEDFLRDDRNLGTERRVIIKRAHEHLKLSDFAFKCKVEALARSRHRYLVNVIGFCMVKGERILVYEYMPNGTLFDRLHRLELEPLPWDVRVRIAVCLACALEYLHHGCSPPLVHKAVTSQNVLLSADMTAKLSDFGISRGASEETGRKKRSRVRGGGSIPPVPPSNSQGASSPPIGGSNGVGGEGGSERGGGMNQGEKVDVYGFGVVLLELITGQKAMKDVHITSVVAPFLDDPQMMPLMVDPQLGGYFNQSELIELGSIARECVREEPFSRPSMKEVLAIMEEKLRLDSAIFDDDEDEILMAHGGAYYGSAASVAASPLPGHHRRTNSSAAWSSFEHFAHSIKSVLVSPRDSSKQAGASGQGFNQSAGSVTNTAGGIIDPSDVEMSSSLLPEGSTSSSSLNYHRL